MTCVGNSDNKQSSIIKKLREKSNSKALIVDEKQVEHDNKVSNKS